MQITGAFRKGALHSFALHLGQESHEVIVIESHGGLIWFPKVKVTNKLRVDGNLSSHQRVGGREPSLSEEVTLGLDVHLMFVAELLVQIGGKIEQKSVGGT